MAEFVEVARVDDVAAGTAHLVRVGGLQLALVNVDGSSYAVDNECPHRGGFLGQGEINADWHDWALECPLPASVFDVRTGRCSAPRPQSQFEPMRSASTKGSSGWQLAERS
jgi:nitrite reductase (NADH) small subunit